MQQGILSDKRIFMVEDNNMNKAVAQLIIERHHGEVFMERWGRNTIEKIKEAMPLDVIIMDLMLPNSSGYEIYEAIKQDPELNDIPVLVVSAADPGIEMPKVRKAGFNGFISKPISITAFGRQLKEVIDGEQVWEGR